MKKQGKKWMLVALALLAVVTVALPLVGCKNDSVSEQTGGNAEQPATPGTGDGTGSGDGNQGTGDGTGSGSGNQGSGDPEQPVTYTVSFYTNGGGSIDSQPIVRGQTATKPADPTLENNVFDGWYSDAEFSKPYDFTTPVTSSFTLYAKWVEGTEVTVDNVSSVIAGLTGEEPHTLVVTGELNDLSAIKAALEKKPNAKVNLDLSKATRLTSIGDNAFSGCDSLTSISIPEGVTTIGAGAFGGCSSLTSISIPSSVTSIGNFAFRGCDSLTSISIPSSVTSIGDAAFYGCSSLNISVKENNTKYSSVNGMLLNKEKTILIADPSAKVTVNNVPTSVTTIMRAAFRYCDSLTSISIPSSVEIIGDWAFGSCSGLTSIDLSKATGLTSIGDYAFMKCDSLTSISIPEGVTTIGEAAFSGCSGLTSISIPSSVTSIGDGAFRGCSGATVKVEAENPPKLGSLVFEDVSKILVPNVDNYTNEDAKEKGWEPYKDKIIEQTS